MLCYASQEILSLQNRCCPIVKFDQATLNRLQTIVKLWLDCLSQSMIICIEEDIKLDWNTIADLWQGTLFSYMCYIMGNDAILYGDKLGYIQHTYERYMKLISQECKKEIEPYPIKPIFNDLRGKLPSLKYKQYQIDLCQINNAFIQQFCGDNSQGVKWRKAPTNLKSQEFDEVKHWHCNKALTDDFDHVKDNAKEDTKNTRKYRKPYNNYLEIYGRNLEGNAIKARTIVCENVKDTDNKVITKKGKKNKNKETKEEVSNGQVTKANKTKKDENKLTKKQQIIEDSKNKKEQEQLQREKEQTERLQKNIKNYDFEEKINTIDTHTVGLKMRESRFSVALLKLKIYRDHIKMNNRNIDKNHVKVIFLLIQEILENYRDLVTKKDEILISKLLHQFGFHEIAQRNDLPLDIQHQTLANYNWVRYQLEYLGPEMKRLSGGTFDRDVGFTPDPWQVEFIEAIRKKQSALVVAPTSSGKTFAAYYCMQKVLEESLDGVVVYVAPTKALVNQIHATVYARFKNINLPDGKAVVGVFTRDYKMNTLNSRILVTVPQCLDILLMSPRRYTWLKLVKYVIFDEVHKLSGSDEGVVWERCLLMIQCPFLALSATISDIDEFHNWLQSNENFKKEQDQLHGTMRASYNVKKVIHTARHSDLIKYIYGHNHKLQHYHPYCAFDENTLNIHSGIPSSISLSSHEVLQLYDAIYHLTPNELPIELDPVNFFSNICKNGYIDRNNVTKYEEKLSKVFYDIYIRDKVICGKIIQYLSPESDEISDIIEIPKLLDYMHEHNMLPCLIFSYNRVLIEFADNMMIKELSKTTKEVNRREEKQKSKIEKMEKKSREKEERGNRDDKATRSIKTSYILNSQDSKFKGRGKADSDDLEHIENRLSRTANVFRKSLLVESLPFGIAYHHSGLNNVCRSTVEMLFRMGVVRVVFATGTLALGIHMPCKSIVIYGDSPFLNSIEYHQMSGRAGRRGFDTEGHVIFMGLTKKRQDMLMTGQLPKMLGNFPIKVTLIARLLLLVAKVTDRDKSSETVTNKTISRALTLLENSLIYQQQKPNLKLQIKYFADFATQLLLIQGVVNEEGIPLKLAGLVTHLHYHEPANLVFAYLLRSGILRDLVTSEDNRIDIQWSLIIVLSYLFAPLKLHKLQLNKVYRNSKVILDPLHDIIAKGIQNYNKEVKFVFNEYFISVARSLANVLGNDDTLPVSKIQFTPLYSHTEEEEENEDTLSAKIKSACVKRTACSSFIALSGNDDNNLYTGTMISNIRHEIDPGIKLVPLIDIEEDYNGYAADFYRHGIVQAIMKDNGLKQGSEFAQLVDFQLVLRTIVMSLEELDPRDKADPIYVNFKQLSDAYDQKFYAAFK